LIIQRAVEEEFDTWLGRAPYERRPDGPPGKRNGFRPRHVQTAEGELRIEIPQVREAAMPFVSKLFPKWHCKRLLRTDPYSNVQEASLLASAKRRTTASSQEPPRSMSFPEDGWRWAERTYVVPPGPERRSLRRGALGGGSHGGGSIT
jgi:hypothetical protein